MFAAARAHNGEADFPRTRVVVVGVLIDMPADAAR